jgi:predicted secreted acid phosphatase
VEIDNIVERYVKLRDRKAELKKAYEASVADIDQGMEKIENFLLKTLQEMGTEAFKTASGTAYVTTKTSATIKDWDEFRSFLSQQEDPYYFLDRRANKTAVEEYSKEHNEVPSGINWTAIKAVNIRRS